MNSINQKYWCKHFVSFDKLRRRSSGTIRDARCWALDNFDSRDIDIFATDEDGGGIAFAREQDLSMFLLVWA